MKREFRFIGISIILACCSCAVGHNHTRDAVLEHRFAKHRNEFETLLREVQGDSKIQVIHPDVVVYGGKELNPHQAKTSDVEQTGLKQARLRQYEEQIRELQIAGGVIKNQDESEIEFRVDQASLFNGDSYKGYAYRSIAPTHIRASLDDYRIVPDDKDRWGGFRVYRHITGNWYLYLYVN